MTKPPLTELDLVVAATPFFRAGTHAPSTERREALRAAVFGIIRQRGAIPPCAVIDTRDQALAVLKALLKRCEELRVNWSDIVAIVNREWDEPARDAAPAEARA